jgi:hypothetical protein
MKVIPLAAEIPNPDNSYLATIKCPSGTNEGALTTSSYLASLVSSGKSRMLRFIQPCIYF